MFFCPIRHVLNGLYYKLDYGSDIKMQVKYQMLNILFMSAVVPVVL